MFGPPPRFNLPALVEELLQLQLQEKFMKVSNFNISCGLC